jgi:hypothetical protein
MRLFWDTNSRSSGIEDDSDPVPSRHQSDVSQMANAPSATEPRLKSGWWRHGKYERSCIGFVTSYVSHTPFMGPPRFS